MTQKQLRWWFGHLNKKYFYGKLKQPDRIFFSHKIKIVADVSTTNYGARELRINKRIKTHKVLVIPTLLHEMIHMYHPKEPYPYHGHSFNRTLKRLLRRGAFTRWL